MGMMRDTSLVQLAAEHVVIILDDIFLSCRLPEQHPPGNHGNSTCHYRHHPGNQIGAADVIHAEHSKQLLLTLPVKTDDPLVPAVMKTVPDKSCT